LQLNEITRFTAIDFETGTPQATSICQIGIVEFINNEPFYELNLLVQPPNNEIWYNFTRVHGIKPKHTADAPTFAQVWPSVKPFIEGKIVVAHNGHAFDFPVLNKTLEHYQIAVPDYTRFCTLKIYKKGLGKLAIEHQIPHNHHDALSDAKVCGILFAKHILALQEELNQ
jgi:DNA polymerase-3 subunit epsilon